MIAAAWQLDDGFRSGGDLGLPDSEWVGDKRIVVAHKQLITDQHHPER